MMCVLLVLEFNLSMKKLLFYILITGLSLKFNAQNLDSLEKVFLIEQNKFNKEMIASKLIFEVYKTTGDINKSLFYYNYVIKNSDINYVGKNPYVIALRNRGIIFYYTNEIDSALIYFNKSLAKAVEVKDSLSECKNLNNIASIYYHKGESKKALDFYLEGGRREKNFGFTEGENISLNNIGYIFSALKMHEKSRYYFRKGLNYAQKTKDYSSLIYSYDGLSTTYVNNKDSNHFYKFKAYDVALKINDINNAMHSSADIAQIYLEKHDYKKAYKYANESLIYSIKLKNSSVKSIIYMVLASIANIEKNNTLALSYCDSISKYLNNKNESFSSINLYKILSGIFESCNKPDSAIKYFKKASIISDSLYKTELTSIVAELQSKYDISRKETEILELNKTNKQKQMIIYVSIFVFGIVTLLTVNIFRISSKRKKLNLELQLTNTKVEKQKNKIEEHQKEILDSIHYAKRIQNTLLAHHDFLNDNIPNNFVYFNPKDIVSGDFYWATKHGSNFYLAVCDSTGHGVPGAFMSLLNIGFLSEAINEKNITETNLIFEYVRERLISSVSKEGQKDGFDGIIVRFNQSTKEITYTAAHNAPILISNNELIELQKDKMPVGIGERSENFTCHKLQVKQGDMLYLYTDGYADQFGGPKGKKFKYKPLNELLLSISNKTLSEQKQELETNFKNWKGDLEQVDDVLIIGLKL